MNLEEVKQRALIRIVDDDEGLADALKFFLEVEGWQTQVHHRVRSFFSEDRPSVPGCILLDVRMPELTGIECQRMLKERQIALPVVMMTGHGNIDMAVQAVLDGAIDFLQKPVDEERLLRAVTKAATLSVEHCCGVVNDDDAVSRVAQLTTRELEIARLVAQGLVSRQIGERLGIATRTVEVHRAGAIRKLGVRQPEEIRTILDQISQASPGA